MGMRDNNYAYTRNAGRRLGGDWQGAHTQERSGCGCGRSDRDDYARTQERSGCGCSRSDRDNYARTQERSGCGCGRSDRDDYARTQQRSGCGCLTRGDSGVRTRANRENYGRNTRSDIRSGCGCMDSDTPVRSTCNECHELMNQLQKLDFSIQETVLYLDAYPDCCEAKNYYHQLIHERQAIAEAYESACGPLSAWSNESTSTWDWTRAPWPWHPDFPGNKKA